MVRFVESLKESNTDVRNVTESSRLHSGSIYSGFCNRDYEEVADKQVKAWRKESYTPSSNVYHELDSDSSSESYNLVGLIILFFTIRSGQSHYIFTYRMVLFSSFE